MKKYLFYSMVVAIALCATACNKNKSDVEDKSQDSNPYPYLRISDVEIYYEKTISEAEDILYKNGYKGGFISGEYKYQKETSTIVLDVTDKIVREIYYTSTLKVLPTEVKEWLLHPTATYQGKYTLLFNGGLDYNGMDDKNIDLPDFESYKNYINAELNSSSDIRCVWMNANFTVWGDIAYSYASSDNQVASLVYGDAPMANSDSKPTLEPPTL